jgi:GTP cyclohydrolase I
MARKRSNTGKPLHLVRGLLSYVGENPNREGLQETPARVLKALKFWCSGYGEDPAKILKTFKDGSERYNQLVFVGNIPLYSQCEHHMAPFFGVAHVGYIPDGRVVGLSKLPRLVDVFARRLSMQEKITTQVAHALMDNLQPLSVGVVLRCRHMCMESRGICKVGAITMTAARLGGFEDDNSSWAEFQGYVARAEAKTCI